MDIHSTAVWSAAVLIKRRLFAALILAFFVASSAPFSDSASAKAPPLATTIFDTEALAAPDYGSTQLLIIPQGTEVELTGNAQPGFLAVYYDGQVVWVPAQYLSIGDRPGVDTAFALEDTPLLEAPMNEANVLETVLAGESVILTGASVDGYDAASHDGTGGWILERALSR